MKESWLVIDIGGTKLSAALFDGEKLQYQETVPTLAQMGQESVLERIIALLEHVQGAAGLTAVRGIGVACPGPLSGRQGVVYKAPMLGWENVPLVSILQTHFHCPVILENDANAAALGEALLGAGQGASSMAYITVSTGVGCGIVLQGELLRGLHESAGELGHLVTHPGGRMCACGRRGCLECYASGTAIGRDATECLRARGQDSPITAKEAARMARQGDADMRDVFFRAGQELGLGIGALLQLLDIERIVLGGSVAQSFDLLQAGIRQSVSETSYWGKDTAWLSPAKLGGASGLLGAAVLISQEKGVE